MTQVVQAKCPKCGKMLRFPAEWVAQPMRCKYCKQVFQSKSRPVPESGQIAVSAMSAQGQAAMPASAVPSAVPRQPVQETEEDGFFGGFGQSDLISAPRLSSPRQTATQAGKGGWKIVVLLVAIVAVVISGVAVIAGPTLKNLLLGDDPGPKIVDHDKSSFADPKKKTSPTPGNTVKKASTNPGKKDPLDPSTKVIPAPKGEFPRRALFININDYLLMNPLAYGSPTEQKYPGSSTGALAYQFTRPPMNLLESQIAELSDGIPSELANRTGRKPKAPLKGVIEATLKDFLEASRAQDRIIVVIAGHVVDGEKECYLVPIEGNKEDPATLISLGWIYGALAQCKARQKLLIFDLCRFPPALGLERPGPGEMSEQLEAILQKPPEGVQVWSSCSKGQQSIELDKGSVFLQSLCAALMKGVKGIQEPTNPLPLEALVADVNQRLKDILGPQKLEQVSRLTGKEVDNGAAYNPDELTPDRLVIKPPKVEGGDVARAVQVKEIEDEINKLPSVRMHHVPVQLVHLLPFSAKALDEYQADYKDWKTMAATVNKEPEKYPLRKAVLDGIAIMEESRKLAMEERLTNPGGGTFDGKLKAAFLAKQRDPGIMIFEMEKVLRDFKAAGDDRDKEPSKRWQVTYDYTLARMQSRLVYIYEYSFLLGRIRADDLPNLEPIHNGWRLGARPKVQVPEGKVKDMVKNISKTWKRIGEEYPGTPWAMMATRENLTALGLEWRPTRD